MGILSENGWDEKLYFHEFPICYDSFHSDIKYIMIYMSVRGANKKIVVLKMCMVLVNMYLGFCFNIILPYPYF